MDELELIVANISGQIRRLTYRGREYLVAPVTMIVPGVLNGSEGPGYYPEEENIRDPYAWNHMPIVMRHPIVNGKPVSARKPEVLDKYQIGYVFESKADPKLGGEAWFDVEWTRNADAALPDDKKVLPRLERGEPVAVSTGLGVTKDKKAGVFNGVSYKWIARNYRPDHLAVLPDEPGACDIKDGCGVLVNEEQPVSLINKIKALLGIKPAASAAAEPEPTTSNSQGDTTVKLTPQQRTGYVNILVANCACKKPETRKAFEALPDAELQTLANAKGKKPAVVNADGEGEVADGIAIGDLAAFLGVTADPAADPVGYTKEITDKLETILKKLKGGDATPADTATPADVPAPTGNRKRTDAEWLADAPASVKELLNSAKETEQERKTELVNKLVAHLPEDQRQAKAKVLMNRKLVDLKEMVSLLPPVANRNSDGDNDGRRGASYWGAQGASVVGGSNADVDNSGGDEDELLPPAVINAGRFKQKNTTKKVS